MTAMELERWDDGSHRPEDHAIQDFFNQAGEAAATGHPWRGRWLKFRGGISGARDFGALREDAIKEYRDASLRWYHAAGEAKAQGQTGRAKWYVLAGIAAGAYEAASAQAPHSWKGVAWDVGTIVGPAALGKVAKAAGVGKLWGSLGSARTATKYIQLSRQMNRLAGNAKQLKWLNRFYAKKLGLSAATGFLEMAHPATALKHAVGGLTEQVKAEGFPSKTPRAKAPKGVFEKLAPRTLPTPLNQVIKGNKAGELPRSVRSKASSGQKAVEKKLVPGTKVTVTTKQLRSRPKGLKPTAGLLSSMKLGIKRLQLKAAFRTSTNSAASPNARTRLRQTGLTIKKSGAVFPKAQLIPKLKLRSPVKSIAARKISIQKPQTKTRSFKAPQTRTIAARRVPAFRTPAARGMATRRVTPVRTPPIRARR